MPPAPPSPRRSRRHARVTSLIGTTPFHDLERGFHAVELEMLPEEMGDLPEFAEGELER